MSDTSTFVLNGSWLSGPTYKVALMLSLSGLSFGYRAIDLRGGEQRTPEFQAKTPFGQVPVLEHGGRCLAQSAAILQYLADTLGRFGGADAAERAEIAAWMFWDFDRLAPGVYRSRTIRLGILKVEEPVREHYTGVGDAALTLLEKRLAGRDWLVGSAPTIADIDAYGVVAFAAEGGFDLARFPAIGAWKARFEALPGWATNVDLLSKETRL